MKLFVSALLVVTLTLDLICAEVETTASTKPSEQTTINVKSQAIPPTFGSAIISSGLSGTGLSDLSFNGFSGFSDPRFNFYKSLSVAEPTLALKSLTPASGRSNDHAEKEGKSVAESFSGGVKTKGTLLPINIPNFGTGFIDPSLLNTAYSPATFGNFGNLNNQAAFAKLASDVAPSDRISLAVPIQSVEKSTNTKIMDGTIDFSTTAAPLNLDLASVKSSDGKVDISPTLLQRRLSPNIPTTIPGFAFSTEDVNLSTSPLKSTVIPSSIPAYSSNFASSGLSITGPDFSPTPPKGNEVSVSFPALTSNIATPGLSFDNYFSSAPLGNSAYPQIIPQISSSATDTSLFNSGLPYPSLSSFNSVGGIYPWTGLPLTAKTFSNVPLTISAVKTASVAGDTSELNKSKVEPENIHTLVISPTKAEIPNSQLQVTSPFLKQNPGFGSAFSYPLYNNNFNLLNSPSLFPSVPSSGLNPIYSPSFGDFGGTSFGSLNPTFSPSLPASSISVSNDAITVSAPDFVSSVPATVQQTQTVKTEVLENVVEIPAPVKVSDPKTNESDEIITEKSVTIAKPSVEISTSTQSSNKAIPSSVIKTIYPASQSSANSLSVTSTPYTIGTSNLEFYNPSLSSASPLIKSFYGGNLQSHPLNDFSEAYPNNFDTSALSSQYSNNGAFSSLKGKRHL